MSNIVGEGFAREIREQVDTRQKIYGTINRTNEQLQYLNANTGWVRLASSVDIKANTEIRGFPASLKNNELAKKYVLFGGIGGAQGTNFNNLYENPFNTEAYGIGGLEFGIKPMPGIKSAQIKTLTRGSLKEATIQITANNRTQFDIIDILYLRLGFTMLLEWGHASYFDNTEMFINDNPFGNDVGFLNGSYGYDDILDTIQYSRLASKGNYDAIAGKVVNFNWKYNRDGTYDITLILRSLGDVIESLKANILLGDGEDTLKTPPTLLQRPNVSNAPPTLLQRPNINIINTIVPNYTNSPTINPSPNISEQPATSYSNSIEKLTLQLKQSINQLKEVADSGMQISEDKDYFGQAYNGESSTQYYIRLGYFLGWLEKNILPKVKKSKISPIIKIDNDIDSNIILLHSDQISADPSICTFKKSIRIEGDTVTFSPSAANFINYF